MTIRRPAAPNFFWTSISPAVSSAFFCVAQTTTPLPAARPSALTTTGKPNSPEARIFRACSKSSVTLKRPVGIRWRPMNSLAKTLLPSISAAFFDGPKIFRPRRSNSSTMPMVRGISGPTTVSPIFSRSAKSASPAMSVSARGTFSATSRVPPLPGAQ